MSIMGKIHKVEKFFDVLMSFATLVGFASTAYLVWIFLNTPPTIVVSTTTVGAPGIVGYPVQTYVIQGVPFSWIFTSLIPLSRSHLPSCKTLNPDLGRKTLLPTRSTPHANPANPHTNRTKTKTNRTQPIGKSINPTGTPLVRESDGLGPNIIPSLRTTRTENPLLDASNIDMTGKVCLVTGGNSGIGKATALGLAKLNASVVIVSRDKDKGEAALIEMRAKSGNRNLDAMTADLSSQDFVREVAHDFKGRYKKLNVLINNAGIFLPRRVQTVDGLEATFATNHLGHFLLTNLLMDVLKASGPSRIINLTSSAHYGTEMDFEDLQGEKKYSGYHAYSQSKLANVLFTYQLAKQLEGTGVTVNSLHPGVVRTGFGKDQGGLMSILVTVGRPFMISPYRAARAAIYLATSPELEDVTGKFFSRGREKRSSRESYDETSAQRLWKVSEELTRLNA